MTSIRRNDLPVFLFLLFVICVFRDGNVWAAGTAKTTPSSGWVGASMVPETTVFHFECSSVPAFNRDFLIDHYKMDGIPAVKTAAEALARNPIVKTSPGFSMPPLASDCMAALYGFNPNRMFMALTPQPRGGLCFLTGGEVARPEEVLKELQEITSKKMPGLTWETSRSDGMVVIRTQIPQMGPLVYAGGHGWLLMATDPDAMGFAMARLQNRPAARKMKSLAQLPEWKENLVGQKAGANILYFTRLEGMVTLVAEGEAPALARLFKNRLGGLKACSWTWTTQGFNGRGQDRFVLTVSETTARAIRSIAAPVEPDPLVGKDTVFSMVFRLSYGELFQTPMLRGLVLSAEGESWLKKMQTGKKAEAPLQTLLLTDHTPGAAHSAWVIRLPKGWKPGDLVRDLPSTATFHADFFEGRTASFLIAAGDRDSAQYFRQRIETLDQESKSGPVRSVTPLPTQKNALMTLALDRERILGRCLSELERSRAAVLPVLKSRGVQVPEHMPEPGPTHFTGPMQMSLGLQGNRMILDNYFQLRNSASTVITASTRVAIQAYRPELEREWDFWKKLAVPVLTPATGSEEANLYEVMILSNDVLGPLILKPTDMSLGVDC
ncbi:MAG: hypothetical protein SFY92_12335, partial [Verrucomicrobiae bacterium]|nr:hypothetical protein [Verrucomicrobiae bacterium]